jgi:hypothetical protein
MSEVTKIENPPRDPQLSDELFAWLCDLADTVSALAAKVERLEDEELIDRVGQCEARLDGMIPNHECQKLRERIEALEDVAHTDTAGYTPPPAQQNGRQWVLDVLRGAASQIAVSSFLADIDVVVQIDDIADRYELSVPAQPETPEVRCGDPAGRALCPSCKSVVTPIKSSHALTCPNCAESAHWSEWHPETPEPETPEGDELVAWELIAYLSSKDWYWCTECKRLWKDKDHRCEQWSQMKTIPGEAIKAILESAQADSTPKG